MRAIDTSRFGEIMEQWKKDCLADNDTQGADIISDVILQLDDMPTLTQPNEWISTDKCTPEPMKDVLVMFENGIMCVGFTYYDYRLLNRWSIHIDHALYQPCPINPKYWTLLPKPPKEELKWIICC